MFCFYCGTTSHDQKSEIAQALSQLSKGDIVEVKAMGKPPGGPACSLPWWDTRHGGSVPFKNHRFYGW